MSRAKAIVALVVGLSAWTAAPGARAATDDDDKAGYSSLAVQNRTYRLDHEITAAIGVLPLDAFTKGFTVGGAYTLHFDEVYAWEVVNFVYSFPIDTDLKDDLIAFDLRPTPFEVVNYYVTTNFVFKPLYFKGAVLNDSMAFGEVMFLIGGGYGWFTRSNRPALDYGIAFRIFASETFSFRLDARHTMFMTIDDQTGFDVHSELWIGLGVSLSL